MADTSLVLNEIIAGDALGMGAAARLLPAHRGEGRACPSTIWRWAVRGYRTPDGRVVRLEAARFAGRWLTSRAALARFGAAITSAALPPDSSTSSASAPRTQTQRNKATQAAIAKLKAAGA